MKIYVDELPEQCFDCPCFRDDIEMCCGLDDGTKDYHNFVEDSNCPLETIQSIRQKVRKEIIKEIRQLIEKEKQDNDLAWLGFKKLNRILDQVKGENNVKD